MTHAAEAATHGSISWDSMEHSGKRQMARPTRLQTVGKTIFVLERFLQLNSGSVTLSKMAEELNWSRAATHQYLSSLVEAGWLQQTSNRQYELSSRAAIFGRFAADNAGIPAPIVPIMHELVAVLNEPISFAVRSGTEVLIIERLEPRRPFAIGREAERRMPMDSTSGQVLRAFDPHLHLTPSQPDCKTQKIKEQGFAYARAEWLGDTIEAIAVPIMESSECIGALSVIAPEGRMSVMEAIEALTSARIRIEQALTRDLDKLNSE